MTNLEIPSFTATCLVITSVLCLVAVLVAWYTVRDRVKFSQMILGIFCYVLVMLLESAFDMLAQSGGIPTEGIGYAVYIILSVVAARELVRFGAMEFGVRRRFTGADSALGFALGFAGTYLFICSAYYFNCYTAVRSFLSSGMDGFVSAAGTDANQALSLLESIAAQTGWQFLATGVNRVFFLVRELALCVLLWYAMEDGKDRRWLALVPVMHLIAMVPDGLFQAGLLENSFVKDGATCVLSAGIAFLAARQYNAREDQVAHYQIEHLRARRR